VLLRKSFLAGVALIASAAGMADESSQQGAANQASQDKLDEIVVTARRREERLQDVPTAVEAFDKKALTEKSITSSFDLARNVPGLIVDTGPGGVQEFSIRGRGLNFGAAAGSVETYFAEVPLSAPYQMPTLPPQYFDLASLEVLKGPQGTLFGRSTTGGAVLITPQAPTNDFGGYARLQGGNYDDFQAEAALNVPLVADHVLLRVAVFDWQRQGYMRTTGGTNEFTGGPLGPEKYDNQDVKELRATLLVRPVEGLQNSTIFTYHWDDNRQSAGPGLNILGVGAPNGLGAYYSPGYGTRLVTYGFDQDHPTTRVWAFINTTNYELTPSLTVKNIFGVVDSSGYVGDGNTGTGIDVSAVAIDTVAPPRPRKNMQYTEELQLQGRTFLDDRLSWVVGGLLDQEREPGALGSYNFLNLDSLFGAPISILERNTVGSEALFGSAIFKITDKLNITGGYRHSFDEVKLATSGFLPGTVLTPPAADVQYFQKYQQGNAGNVELDYHPTSQVMVYGGWRLGYKHGGFNATSTPGLESFAPEKVNDYFAGVKSDFAVAGMPVRLNVEAYYDLYSNMQVSYYTLLDGGVSVVTSNIPKTTFRGLEMDLTAKPSDWLMLTANYAFLDAFNTRWPDNTVAGETGDLAGNPVPYANRSTGTVTMRLHTELPHGMGEIALAPSISSQSRSYTTPTAFRLTNATQVVAGPFDMAAHGGGYVPGYTLFDLRAEWNQLMGSRVDLAVNAINLANKLYFLGNSGTLMFGAESNFYAPPRMISAELSTKF
jgi:iron complex outermembrane recepter protein